MPYGWRMSKEASKLAKAFVRGFAKGYAPQAAFEDVPPHDLRQRLMLVCKTARTGLDGAPNIADPARRAEYLASALERILGVAWGDEA